MNKRKLRRQKVSRVKIISVSHSDNEWVVKLWA